MDKTLLSLVIIFFIAFVVFTSAFFVNKPLSRVTRASITNKTVDVPQTLIFAWPLAIPANGKDESTITVFARNSETEGLAGKPVNLTSTTGSVQESVVTTDSNGKATFHLTSRTKGVAEIEIMVDNIKIQKPLSVSFE